MQENYKIEDVKIIDKLIKLVRNHPKDGITFKKLDPDAMKIVRWLLLLTENIKLQAL